MVHAKYSVATRDTSVVSQESVEVEDTASTAEDEEYYSSTPIRIGYWLDGVSVWRVAIPITDIGEIGIANPENGWHIRTVDVLYNLGMVNSTSSVFVLNDNLVFQNDSTYDDTSFGTATKIIGGYEAEADSTDYAQSFFGWIEFYSAAENVNL